MKYVPAFINHETSKLIDYMQGHVRYIGDAWSIGRGVNRVFGSKCIQFTGHLVSFELDLAS